MGFLYYVYKDNFKRYKKKFILINKLYIYISIQNVYVYVYVWFREQEPFKRI